MLIGGGNYAWAQDAGTYYIQNVGTGKWLSPANSWETQASVLDHADYWKLAKISDGVYTLESVVSNGNSKIYLNGGYCDGGTNNLTFAAIGGKTNTYSIKEGTKYYTTDGTTASASANDASSDNAQWKLYTASDLTTAMNSATPASGVDATWLILDHNLSRNNRDYSSAWSNTGATAPKTQQDGAASNRYSIEAFQKTFDVHQSLTSIPNGVYGLQVNGFYRQDGSDKLPYLYAGDNKVTLPSRTGTENDMQAAAESFVAGNYLSDRVAALVTDGNLNVGVATKGTSCWTIFKNFHLTYYGNPTVANPLDMTSWITNPDMEEDGAGTGSTYKRNITGWSHNNTDDNYRPLALPNGNIDNTSNAFTNSYCFELYREGGLSGKKVYQTITGLPNGVYKVQLAAFINGDATNEYIYALCNGQTFTKTLDGTANQTKLYSVYAIVSDGTMEIGLDMNTSSRTWVCIDNAHLYYYGASDEAYELVSDAFATSHVVPVPSTYPLNSTTATNPFDNGAFKEGNNVTALNVNNTTATAWIGSKDKPVTLNENEAISISFTAYHGWLATGANQGVKLLNSGGHTIAEYVYHLRDRKISAVNIGGSTASGFTEITEFRSLKDASSGANGFTNNPYKSEINYNTVFTFDIRYDGYITVTISRGQGNKLYTYTDKLPDNWDVDLQKMQIYSNSNNDDRTIGISDLKIERTYAYEIMAIDGSGNEIATILRGAAKYDGSTTAYWNKYIKVDDQWYETTGSYGKSITTAENKVTYAVSDIDYFVEGEKMTGYSAAAQYIGTAYSGGIRGRHAGGSNWKMGVSISEAGPYTISFPHKYDSSSSESVLTLTEVKSDESETQIEEKSISADGTYTKDYNFSAGSDLKISKGSGNSNYMIDYVTIAKKAVSYKVKYMCGETEIKTADDSRTAKWGTIVALEDADKENIIYNHATYAYSSDDAATVEIASDGSSIITVTFTKVPFYELVDVTTSATWDWSVITSEKAYGQLTDESTPTKSEDFILKNLELYGKQDGSSYSIPAGFGNAQQLEVIAEYPFRYHGSTGKLQGSSVKFHTTVPGTVKVKFSNTGSDARPDRHVSVNGTLSESGSANTTPITSEAIPVAAGDVTITGYIPSTSESAMLQIYNITFTPAPEVVKTSSANLLGYKTFYDADFNYQVDESTTIYKASAYTAGKSVTLTPVAGKIVPKNTPVVLKTTDAGYNITLTPTASDSEGDFTGNLLGVYKSGEWSKSGSLVVYMLGYTESEKFGLYLYTATPDEGDIAVLVPSGGTAKKVSLVVDGEATEVVAPEVAEVDEEEVLFNMAGIQVDKNFKGMVINQKGVKRFNR